MIGISQKLYVLVEALLYIAFHTNEHPLGGKKLAATLNVSPRYLEPLLQSLVRADILRSVRGPRGGYMLARERNKIALDSVWRALEQDKQSDDMVRYYSDVNTSLVQPLFDKAYHAYVSALSGSTLDDLCKQARKKQLDHIFTRNIDEHTQRIDYSI